MKRNFKLPVGYSDHTIGFEVPIAAVAKGASIIEKHITFNVNGRGPDHKASMSFKDFTIMVKCIRNIEKSLGNKIKKISNFEKENQYIVRKSIFASKKIKKGEILTYENICIKRPGTGLSPMLIDKFIGKKSKFNFKKNESIK